MKLKKIVALMSLVAVSGVYAVDADSISSQIQTLQQQVASLQQQVNQAGSGTSAGAGMGQLIQLNGDVMFNEMNNFTGVGEGNLLKAKSTLTDGTLYVGGYAQGGLSYYHGSNDSLDTDTSNQSNISLDRVYAGLLFNLNQYAAAYVQMGERGIGAPSNMGSADTSVNFTHAYVLLGNASLPVYGFMGLKDVDFGSMETVDMYAQPLTRDFFAATAMSAGVGYQAYGFDATVSVMNGGAQGTRNIYGTGLWSTAGVSGAQQYGLYTASEHQISNFALNGNYSASTNGVDWKAGAGYLSGSALGNKAFGDRDLDSDGLTDDTAKRVGAWDLNGQFSFQGVKVLGEYVTTASKANFVDEIGGPARAQAWDLGASYELNALIPNKSVVSFDYSGAKLSNQKDHQIVLGARNNVMKNVWAGLEYSFNHSNDGVDGSVNISAIRLDLTTYI